MAIISEDDIEKAFIAQLIEKYQWETIDCNTVNRDNLNDKSGRKDKSEVLLLDKLHNAAVRLNPHLPESAIDSALALFTSPRRALSLIAANREIDGLLREGIPVEYTNTEGRTEQGRVRVMDFSDVGQNENEYLAVSQLWIKGDTHWRRPDVILYVNGIPLVLVELKNSNVKLRTAYDENLVTYKKDIPRLFQFNAFVILSSATETKVGSLTADWDFFFSWLRPDDEREKVDRDQIEREQISLERAAAGLCKRERLLDYIENFIVYYRDSQKIIAQNHQFIGVNRAIESLTQRKENGGRLGVFWHTQGAGKSFSMIFLVRKVYRRLTGNYTFVVITDRDDLDSQIYKNFLNTNTVLKSDAAQPQNSQQLREFLAQNKRIVFSLIQKFRFDKGKNYPLLSERDDIIVIVDEAHRTQYKELAENMRLGLPCASYLAFTGTPLLGKKRLTHQWFGDYISEYNFAQSIEDGATVPLYYQKRVPEVLLQNEDLSDQLADIYESDNISPYDQERLERQFAQEAEVIKRDARLDKIATDIVEHFSTRGYLGKGMVISVDKFTAVRMHVKVSKLWKDKKNELQGQINKEQDRAKKERLKKQLIFLNETQMGVVISEDADEEKKFQAQGLSVKPHRDRMKKIDTNGRDYEDDFKDPEHPFRLVFVCAMWLTGFDVPTLSTLYLDKPMRDHTLMQAIARANRVTSYQINSVSKRNGEIIDYYNVFRNMKQALATYGMGGVSGTENEADGGSQHPVQEKKALFLLLDNALAEAVAFCEGKGINITQINTASEAFKDIAQFEKIANILMQNDTSRQEFIVYENLITSLYEACKPEANKQQRPLIAVFVYLRGMMDALLQQTSLDATRQKVAELLDQSIAAQAIVLVMDADHWGHY